MSNFVNGVKRRAVGFGPQVGGGGATAGTPQTPNAWGQPQTFGPGYTGPNPGMGPKPLPGPQGSDAPGGGSGSLGQPQTFGPGYTGPNPGMGPKPLPGPQGTDNPSGGSGTIGGSLSGGLQPYTGAGNTGPRNTQWGSTGTWSSGSNPGVSAFNAPPAVNMQTGGGFPQTTTFSAGSNLIGSQINPTDSQRTQTAMGYTDRAAGGIANWSPKPFQSVGPYDASGALGMLGTGYQQSQAQGTAGYRPVAGTDTRGAQGYLDAAARNVNPSQQLAGMAGMGQTGGFGYAGDTSAVRGMSVDQLRSVLNDPTDRAKLAADTYSLMLERNAPQELADDRRYAQRQAALGRAGSGMFNSGLADIATAREQTRDQARRELATNAASLSLQDRMDKLGAASGLGSSLAGQDTAAGSLNLGFQNSNNAERGAAFDRSRALGADAFDRNRALGSDSLLLSQIARQDAVTERGAMNDAERYANDLTQRRADNSRQFGMDQYGIGRDTYGDRVRERDASQAFDQMNFGNQRSLFGDLMGYENATRGFDAQARNELRGERGYQADMDQRAIDNAERQRAMEDRYRQSDLGYANSLMNWGYSQSPYGAMTNAGNQAQGQADASMGGAYDLFGQWARSRALGNPASTGNRPNPYAAGGY